MSSATQLNLFPVNNRAKDTLRPHKIAWIKAKHHIHTMEARGTGKATWAALIFDPATSCTSPETILCNAYQYPSLIEEKKLVFAGSEASAISLLCTYNHIPCEL